MTTNVTREMRDEVIAVLRAELYGPAGTRERASEELGEDVLSQGLVEMSVRKTVDHLTCAAAHTEQFLAIDPDGAETGESPKLEALVLDTLRVVFPEAAAFLSAEGGQ